MISAVQSSEGPLAFVCEFNDGRIACVEEYLDHDEAFKVAGLDA